MFRVVELLGSRRTPHFAAVAVVSIGLSGCSAEMSSRFAQDPMASPYRSRPEATGTIAPQAPAPAPYGRVESRPLPQYQSAPMPAVSAPQTYPSAAAPQAYPPASAPVSGGGRGMASYSPPPAPRIEAPVAAAQAPAAARSVAAAPQAASAAGTTIIVGTGDTLEGLAQRYRVSSSAILAANGYRGPRVLQPGQQLIIPRQSAAAVAAPQPAPAAPAARTAAAPVAVSAPAGRVHVVNRGDTLAGIARRNQISAAQLAAANGMTVDAPLRLGAKITVPAAGKAVAAAPAPAVQATVAAAPQQPAKPMVMAQAQVAPPAAAPVQKANLAVTSTPVEAETPSPVKQAEANSSPTFRWPVRGRIIAGYGAKNNGKQNDGINVAVPEGTPVKAAEDGVVAYAGNELKGYGNLVLIRHSNGYVTAYAHASELMVKRGETIKRGQVIGKAGQSGDVNSPQLHFEIRKGSSPVDPLQFLNGA
ncbi:MAG TPA: peptidoglycan DD-metalloendopeptidase family protein [Xanthobacteraceae bacterium]|nr:peptidoglycan DD-metalloendopeptidase family protein [Xanthobacteraceae bacterium]